MKCRNPSNTKYAREFEFFKDDNNKWREDISKEKSTEKEYMDWPKNNKSRFYSTFIYYICINLFPCSVS